MGITLKQCCHVWPISCIGNWKIIFCTIGLFGVFVVAHYTAFFPYLRRFDTTTEQTIFAFDSLDTINSTRHDTTKKDLRSLWFNVSLSDKDSQLVKKALNDKYKSYLRPITTIIGNLPGLSSYLRHLPEDIIQSGYGLQPYTTETGEDGWIENGIVYRPSRQQNNTEDYTPEYESYVPFDEDLFFGGKLPDPSYRTKKKIILWYLHAAYINPIDGLDPLKACPEFPCRVTTNRNRYFEQSAALIFGANKIRSGPPPRTSQNQVYIFHNHEPQLFDTSQAFGNSSWRSVFNWTFTYRVDSDIVVPYSVIRRRPKVPTDKDYRSIFAQKSGLVAWAVSHCSTQSKREIYVEELRKYIPVDVIGKCGTDTCTRIDRTKCTNEIARKYKFYLGFENALCPDYLTEKLFYYMNWDIVVVARGSDNYYLNLPSNIFINTNDFASPEKLAERLRYLANNETAYIEILRKKDGYIMLLEDLPIYRYHNNQQTLHNDFQFYAVPMCLICQQLWNLDQHSKMIKDLEEWFNFRRCKKPADLNFASNHPQT